MTVCRGRNVQGNVQCRRSRFAAREDDVPPAAMRVLADPVAGRPTRRNPTRSWRARLAAFSAMTPASRVQIAGRFGRRDERLEQGTTDAAAARVGGDIHAFPGDPAIDVRGRVRRRARSSRAPGRPADPARRAGNRRDVTGRSGSSPAPRLERRVTGRDALGVDPAHVAASRRRSSARCVMRRVARGVEADSRLASTIGLRRAPSRSIRRTTSSPGSR